MTDSGYVYYGSHSDDPVLAIERRLISVMYEEQVFAKMNRQAGTSLDIGEGEGIRGDSLVRVADACRSIAEYFGDPDKHYSFSTFAVRLTSSDRPNEHYTRIVEATGAEIRSFLAELESLAQRAATEGEELFIIL